MSLNGHQETQTTPSPSLVHQVTPIICSAPTVQIRAQILMLWTIKKIDCCDYTHQLRLHSSAAITLISCDYTHQLRLHSSAATTLLSCDYTHQLRLHSSALRDNHVRTGVRTCHTTVNCYPCHWSHIVRGPLAKLWAFSAPITKLCVCFREAHGYVCTHVHTYVRVYMVCLSTSADMSVHEFVTVCVSVCVSIGSYTSAGYLQPWLNPCAH